MYGAGGVTGGAVIGGESGWTGCAPVALRLVGGGGCGSLLVCVDLADADEGDCGP